MDRSQSRLAVRYGKEKEERKDKAMIARFDHRPMLTAALALTTTVLFVVVVTLSTLLITLPQAAPSASGSVGANPPAAAPKVMDAGGENYGWDVQPKAAQNADAVERHTEVVERLGNGRLR